MITGTNSFQTFFENHSEVLCLSKPWILKDEELDKKYEVNFDKYGYFFDGVV